ncbi:MAG: hypothetical protein DRQ37_05675, partial [Gammaproteobacteria bacterium]
YGGVSVFVEQQRIDEELGLAGALTAANLAANPDRRQTVFPTDFANADTRISRLGLIHGLTDAWQLEGEASYRKTDSLSSFSGSPVSQTRRQRSFSPRLVGSLTLPTGEVLITAGADFERAGYGSSSLFGTTTNVQSVESF